MTYTYRQSVVEKEKSYSLTDKSLLIKNLESSKEENIYYRDIIKVNPKFAGSKNFPNMYQTVLSIKGRKDLTIRNHHYKGVLNMEDVSESYSLFIRELHECLAHSNYNIIYKKGYSPVWYYLFTMIFFVMLFVFLIIGAVTAFAGSYLYAIGLLVGMLVLFMQMKKFMKKNKPGSYLPDQIPVELLP